MGTKSAKFFFLPFMAKNFHEIRDPLHIFIRLDTDERKVLDSRPFQRLRYIHQLALTYLVYPGATHRRFEHSLGVMELATRVYDVVTNSDHLHPRIRESVSEIGRVDEKGYWRKVLRMGALCHDVGHLPFSHASEDLLPAGWSHERLTAEIIGSEEMQGIWAGMRPPLQVKDIVKVAVGPEKLSEFQADVHFTNWQSILSEIIVGDAFGVDRMDYLLRDSYHAGVAYGKFDHYRLIDTIRILPKEEGATGSEEPSLGIQEGGLQSVESLLLARYFMFSQLYYHNVRRIYDIHLKEFLKETLPDGVFSVSLEEHLKLTDEHITSGLLDAAKNPKLPGSEPARRIIERSHFRLLYEKNPQDSALNPDCAVRIFDAAREKFGESSVRYDFNTQKGGAPIFPVIERDDRISSCVSKSKALEHIPVGSADYVFIEPERRDEARDWLKRSREEIIALKEEESND